MKPIKIFKHTTAWFFMDLGLIISGVGVFMAIMSGVLDDVGLLGRGIIVCFSGGLIFFLACCMAWCIPEDRDETKKKLQQSKDGE